MAQQYYVQSLDDMKMYPGVQVVQLSGDDIGVSTLSRPQHLVLHDDQIVFNDGDQVVYQTTNPTQQYQQQQQAPQHQQPQQQQQPVTTTHYIINEDMSQQQQQQQQQPTQPQQQQVVYQQAPQIDHHRQQQQQQQQQQQHHYQQQDTQQYQHETQTQMQTAQHIPQQPQQQTQQIYYTSDQVLQPGTIVHHSTMAAQQHQQHQQQQQPKPQQYQTQPDYQQQQTQIVHQQQAVLQQSPPQQAQHQHPAQQQQQQQAIQLQTQPQQQQQIVYRMTPSQTTQQTTAQMNVLNNTHVIVQQPSGQQVLIQSPPHQEIIMRQAMPQHRFIYNNRVVYATPTPQHQHQTIMQQQQQQQQQQIQLQPNQIQHPTQHLVQTRVATEQPQQQTQPQQQPQTNVVFQQVQPMQPKAAIPQSQPQQQQIIATAGGQQVVRAAGPSLRGRSPHGRLPGTPIGIRQPATLTTRQVMVAGGSIVRQVRPRSVPGFARGGGVRAATVRAQRPVTPSGVVIGNRPQMITTAAGGTLEGQTVVVTQQHPQQQQQQQVHQQHPQLAQTKQYTITNLTQQPTTAGATQIRPVFRTQVGETMQQQQQQVLTQQQQPQQQQQTIQATPQQQQMIRQTPTLKYRTVAGNVANAHPTTATGNIDMDIEESIQASMVKKDHQKPVAATGPVQLGTNTTLTTYYNAPNSPANCNMDDDQRVVRTQSGSSMTLAEFKKRSTLGGASSPTNNTMPPIGVNMRPAGAMRTATKLPVAPTSGIAAPPQQPQTAVPIARVLPQRQTAATAASLPQQQRQLTSSVQQTSHNNYEIHSQHVLNNRAGQQIAERDRNSAKMLVILASGEQRLITFTLPRESCTVQDLLEQVGVPFDNSTTIQCVENRGANVDFVVTVGFSVNESASELISRAEESLQISRQQEQAAAAAAVANNANANAAPATPATPAREVVQPSSTIGTPNAVRPTTTAATPASTANTPSTADEPARKIVPGFLAVCNFCGFTSMDHAKCERCKRIFHEQPKRLPCVKGSSSAANSPESTTASTLRALTNEEKKVVGRKGGVGYITNSAHRGRGGVSASQRGGRARSGRRPAEAEPVTLTLSSDEEGDDNSNTEANKMSTNPTGTSMPYKAFAFEPILLDKEESLLYADFTRDDVTDLTNSQDKLTTKLICKFVRIGGFRFATQEPIIFTSRGVRIVAQMYNSAQEWRSLDIHKKEVVKIIAHFSTKPGGTSMISLYTLKTCAQYIKDTLQVSEEAIGQQEAFLNNGVYQMRKIIMEFESVPDQARNVIKSMWNFLDEISANDAMDLLQRAAEADRQLEDNMPRMLQPNDNVLLLQYPPGTGGISIRTDDYLCLAKEQYLNDIIIDFYLKWVHNNVIPVEQREKTFIFSTFFYKRLTTLTRNADAKQTAAQKRHARVQKWTKNLNLFDKDYIIIPINEQSHWFLAIICFPWLKGPVTFDSNTPVEPQQLKRQRGKKVSLQIGNTTITPLSRRENNSSNVLPDICRIADEDSERDEAEGDDSDLASEASDNSNQGIPTATSSSINANVPTTTTATSLPTAKDTPTNSGSSGGNQTIESIKQPLILIFDSLAGASRSRVVATLRDYLSCEYRVKKSDAPAHVFNKDNMPGHCVKVPQQNNFTDCGLYLLQYVEQFFLDPIRDYRLPIKQLTNWFDTLTVTKKREDISNLLQRMMDDNNGPGQKIILPAIPFPTLNGQLIECPEDGENAEFEEEEGEEDAADEDDAHTTSEMDVDQSSEEQNKLASSSKTAAAATIINNNNNNNSNGTPIVTARKIVLKRRLPLSSVANTATAAGSISVNGSETTTTATTTVVGSTPILPLSPAGTNALRQNTALKIRKLES